MSLPLRQLERSMSGEAPRNASLRRVLALLRTMQAGGRHTFRETRPVTSHWSHGTRRQQEKAS